MKIEEWEIHYRASVERMNRRVLQITPRMLFHLFYFSLILFFYVSPPPNAGYGRQLSFFLTQGFAYHSIFLFFFPFLVMFLLIFLFFIVQSKLHSLNQGFSYTFCCQRTPNMFLEIPLLKYKGSITYFHVQYKAPLIL